MADIEVIFPGDAHKPDPFTICFVANPVLERPWQSFVFGPDPVMGQRRAFDECVSFAVDCLFGNLPNQAERLLSEPGVAGHVRVVKLWEEGLDTLDANALVGENVLARAITPRRRRFAPLLARFGLSADVAFAVSAPTDFTRASAYAADDDLDGPFTACTIDGIALRQCHRSTVPGTVALHVSNRSLTSLHEFSHAFSSLNQRELLIDDLYVERFQPALNVRIGRPIPAAFCDYNDGQILPDPVRDGLGYGSWRSFHSELLNVSAPAVMDDYSRVADAPVQCRHDALTRRFLLDRAIAKIGR